MELHEIEPATSSSILVLTAAFDSYLVAFNVVCQSSDAGGCNRQPKQLAKQADQRHGKGRRTAETGTWRRVSVDEKIEAVGAQLVEVEALEHSFDQIHLTIEDEVFLLGEVNHRTVIERVGTLRLQWSNGSGQRSAQALRPREAAHS